MLGLTGNHLNGRDRQLHRPAVMGRRYTVSPRWPSYWGRAWMRACLLAWILAGRFALVEPSRQSYWQSYWQFEAGGGPGCQEKGTNASTLQYTISKCVDGSFVGGVCWSAGLFVVQAFGCGRSANLVSCLICSAGFSQSVPRAENLPSLAVRLLDASE